MSVRQRRFAGGALVASGLIAAGVAIAANDPRGLDVRNGDNARPELLAPGVGSPLATEPPLRRNPLWAIPLKSLTATLERPLFSPSRRPPARPLGSPQVALRKVSATAEPAQPPLDLLGVVTGAEDGYAVFINTTTHDVVRLRTGEGHDGWILQSVNGRQVVLERNHRTAVITLPQPSADKK